MVKLSIVILNYNAGDIFIDCLRSVRKYQHEAGTTVYIVDNASTDGSIVKAQKLFPEFEYILSKENLGFGRGNNLALRKINDGYVLLLNPDTVLEQGVLKRMVEFMEEYPEVGASTCKVVFADGKLDLTSHRGFPTPWASFKYFILKDDSLYHLSKMDINTIHEVDAITGAFFLTKADVLRQVNYFDEDYFMYAEDIDLCYKIKQKGYKIMFVPDVKIIHYKGVSSGLKKHSQGVTTASLETKKRSLDAFYSTMKLFYKKHYEKEYPFIINWLIYLGINFKWWQAKRHLTV